MMKKLAYSLIVLMILGFQNSFAQIADNTNAVYSANMIPKDLLPNANVVIRRYNLSFEVKNIGEAITKEHKIITILNEQGEHYATQDFYYDKLSDIEDIEAAIYDTDGTLVRKMKKKDISDIKAYQEEITDSRAKRVSFPHRAYPYTVEYNVRTRSTNMMFYPSWYPQESNRESVQSASFEVIMPQNVSLRYKEFNLSKKVQKIDDRTWRWDMTAVKAFEAEPSTPKIEGLLPKVWIAARDFSIGNVKGNLETWENYGHFQNKLNQGRDQLSDAKKEFLKKLVADCPNDSCKIQRIYEHLQTTTRYVSIQLGIGGWQPMPASEVDRLKYGDCKALSNYMLAMLRVVGIEGRYVVIWRGPYGTEQTPDFANARFNHVIACVPRQKDTLWLECTSSVETAGFLGDTDDRYAMLVDPVKGGQLVRTPRYDERVNQIVKTYTIDCNTEGGAQVKGVSVFEGAEQVYLAHTFAGLSLEEKKKSLYENLGINNLDIKQMNVEHKRGRVPSITMSLDMSIEKWASVSGKRLFIPVNTFSKWTYTPISDSTRRFEVQADDNGWTRLDSVLVNLPEGYKIESRPDPLSIKSPFGSFELSLKIEDRKIWVMRRLVVNNAILPKNKYGELVEFFRNVSKADKGKIVLVKI
jgi:Domain of Unknown Function with PDB structure (DUF3857)/Transglutaminase-like superfamily